MRSAASFPALSCCACESSSVRNEPAIGPVLMRCWWLLVKGSMALRCSKGSIQGFARGRRMERGIDFDGSTRD